MPSDLNGHGPWYSLRVIRELKGFSQASLATSLGVTRQYINDLEMGRRWPSVTTTAKIARALDVPMPAIDRKAKPCTTP